MKTPGAFLMWRMVYFCCKDAWLFPTIVLVQASVGCAHSPASLIYFLRPDQGRGFALLLHQLAQRYRHGRHVAWLRERATKVCLWLSCCPWEIVFVWGYLSSPHVIIAGFVVTVVVWTAYGVFYLRMLTFLWRLSMKYITSLLIEGLEWLHKRRGS